MKILQHSFAQLSLDNITSIIQSNDMGFGSNVYKFEQQFAEYSNKQYNISTNSASAAAFMIFAYLKEKYGECDVYTPSLAFTSPAWATKHFGHNLIWVDVTDNLLFDCDDYLVKSDIPGWRDNPGRKKIVMPILYGGVSSIPNWKLRGDEVVVVDAAHCPHPTIHADYIFTSFHPTKPICSPDGGMISTDILEAAEYFKNYRNFGRYNIPNGYDITQNGFKFYMNNLSATIALESLSQYKKNLEIRKNNYIFVKDKFNDRVLYHDINSSFYFATLITDNANEINLRYNLAVHYPLLHKTQYYNKRTLINTEQLHSKIVNLPLYDIDIYNS